MKTKIILASFLLILGGMALIAGDKPDGWVLSVHGKWTDGVKTLQLGDPVEVNLKVHGTGADGDRLTVALLDGKPHEYTCAGKPGCINVIESFRPEPGGVSTRIFQALSTLATHRQAMPVSAISRGTEVLRQAVLPLNGGLLDIAPAVKQANAGDYTLSLRPLANGRATPPKSRVRGLLHWEPPSATTASIPSLAPGIYELTLISAEGESLGTQIVLVAGPGDYAAMRKAFEEGMQVLATWPPDVDPAAIEMFQSAILFNLDRTAPHD